MIPPKKIVIKEMPTMDLPLAYFAAYAGFKLNTLYSWMRQGKIKAYRLNGKGCLMISTVEMEFLRRKGMLEVIPDLNNIRSNAPLN